MLGDHVVLTDIPLLNAPVVNRFDVVRVQPNANVLVLVLGEISRSGVCQQRYNIPGEEVEQSSDMWWENTQFEQIVAVLVCRIRDGWDFPVISWPRTRV